MKAQAFQPDNGVHWGQHDIGECDLCSLARMLTEEARKRDDVGFLDASIVVALVDHLAVGLASQP